MHLNRKTSLSLFAVLAAAGIALDRIVKIWAASSLTLNDAVGGPDFGLVKMMLVHNEGAAFSIGQGHQTVFVALAAVIVVGIIASLAIIKEHKLIEVVGLGLIAAGAVGNLIDRICNGYVVDMIATTFIDFPVFNVADICVCTGVALFVIYVLFFMDFDQDDKDGASHSKQG